MSRAANLIGQKIGELTVIKKLDDNTNFSLSNFLCKCSCGKECVRKGKSLTASQRMYKNSNCGCIFIGSKRILEEKEISSVKRIFSTYKHSAKIRGLSFDLSFDFFKNTISKRCTYCGGEGTNRRKVTKANEGFNLDYNGIDRVDNTVGYEKTNCVPSCFICNRAKKDLSKEDWELYIKRIINFNKS